MDAPPIQYARTEDGVNIAYTVAGRGPRVLHVSAPIAFASADPGTPIVGPWRTFFQERFSWATFDGRDFGLSDRNPSTTSFEARGADLDAVVNALGWDRFAMTAVHAGCVSAVRFAVREPDRVSKLVLVQPFAEGRAYLERSTGMAARPLADLDPRFFAETIARGAGLHDPDDVARFADAWEQSITVDAYRRMAEAVSAIDLRPELSRIECPTMIVATESRSVPATVSREVAACAPGSELVVGRDTEVDSGLRASADFLLRDRPAADREAKLSPFRTILFTDLESSTALTQAVGDSKAQDVLRGHNDVVRAALAAHEGDEVKHTGDGIMASFGSAVSAVEAALAIQRDLAGGEVRVRVGLNAGEPIQEEGDLFGGSVQLAARVCDRAEPGQVFVSNVVRELCTGKLFQFADQGEATLKGFPEPVRLFTVMPPKGGD